MDQPTPVPPLSEIVAKSGIPYPNGVPYSHITFTLVAWNEAHRLKQLLEWVRPVFDNLVIGVQKSTDDTLLIASEFADLVIQDEHHGYGDATYPAVLGKVKTRWAFKLDADEWPSEDLLVSLSCATWFAEHAARTSGVWIPFRSSVEGQEYTEQHSHLRLFEAHVGWPGRLHSRPPVNDGIWWNPEGIEPHIRHDRSLDEMVQDYLRYLEVGRDNSSWTEHNLIMIRAACEGTAAAKGWDYIKRHEWWPQVLRVAYDQRDPA